MPTAKVALMIAITGYGQQSDRQNGLERGFDHYLVKPAEPTKIAALLADVRKS
jgi:CheY-like chemotaxis protein